MATYLKFHELDDKPFERPAAGKFVLATESLRRAFAEIRSGLNEESPRICLSGGPGIGKSSLASALPKLLGDTFRTVLIRDPSMPWERLKAILIKQLDLSDGMLSRGSLEQATQDGKRIVLILDQAEKIEAESLEHLDVILGYRAEAGEQLVRCVLLANLDEAVRGRDVPLLWWLDHLTTLQLRFSPIPEEGIRAYVDKHLKKAGWKGGTLFTDAAILAIHRFTGGTPGAVGALCEELLGRAAAQRKTTIDSDLVSEQCDPTPDAEEPTGAAEFFDLPPHTEESASGPTPWPELGPRAEESEPHVATEPPRAPAMETPEPEMKVEQGLVPMDVPAPGPVAEAAFPEFHVRRSEPAWGTSTAPLPTISRPPRRGGASGTFKVLVAGCAAGAAALYFYWPTDATISRPRLKRIPPPVVVEQTLPLEALSETGLTSDLRVPDTTATKPQAEPSIAETPRTAREIAAAEMPTSKNEDTESSTASVDAPEASRAAALDAEPEAAVESAAPPASPAPAAEANEPVFEPWAEQEPEMFSTPKAAP
jgi:general secretion pathway protein A